MNMKARSSALYDFLFPDCLKEADLTTKEKTEQLKSEFIRRDRRPGIYLELFMVFLVAGALLFWIMTAMFSLCVEDWKASGDLRVKDLWNILIYVIPYALVAVSVGFLVVAMSLSLLNFVSYYLNIIFIQRKDRIKSSGVSHGGPDAN
ncbi:F-type conjugal transfer protein TrbF [Klebsiella grimontii]|uniref:F-type conjugal transfer protein TrbF n=1 Tax=Klebsiella grimontii TaxID=2058152 RepID=UPI00300D6D16